MKKVKIGNKMLDVVDYDEYIQNKSMYNNSSTAIEFMDSEYVYPIRTQTDTRPGMYSRGAINEFVQPEPYQTEYNRSNVIDMSNTQSITELIDKQDKLRDLEREILTNPDNITVPDISELDSPAMRGLKESIRSKNMDIDKYQDRFGEAFANTKRNLKAHDITLFMLNRFTKGLDIKCTLIFEDRNDNVANPMGKKIEIDLSEYDD